MISLNLLRPGVSHCYGQSPRVSYATSQTPDHRPYNDSPPYRTTCSDNSPTKLCPLWEYTGKLSRYVPIYNRGRNCPSRTSLCSCS